MISIQRLYTINNIIQPCVDLNIQFGLDDKIKIQMTQPSDKYKTRFQIICKYNKKPLSIMVERDNWVQNLVLDKQVISLDDNNFPSVITDFSGATVTITKILNRSDFAFDTVFGTIINIVIDSSTFNVFSITDKHKNKIIYDNSNNITNIFINGREMKKDG